MLGQWAMATVMLARGDAAGERELVRASVRGSVKESSRCLHRAGRE